MRYSCLRLVLIGLLSVGVVSAATAQLDDGPAGVGLYLDLEATINHSDGPVVNPLYLLATNVDFAAGIAEWGLSLRSSDPTTVLVLGPAEGHVSAHGCSPGAIELRRYGNSYEGPIPAGAVVHLATLVVWQHQPEMADIHIEGPHCSPGPDHPYFIGHEPSREVRELTPSSGSVSAPVFRINGPAPVADDATSWGGLKTLYR